MAEVFPPLERRDDRSHDLPKLVRQWFIDCADLCALERQLKEAAAQISQLELTPERPDSFGEKVNTVPVQGTRRP